MRSKKICVMVITLFTILSIFIGLGSISANKFTRFEAIFEDYDNINTPKTALNSLTKNDITINDTEIFRLFETANITVDVSDFPNAYYTKIQLPLLNNTYYNYNMTSLGNKIFTYNYTPDMYSLHVLQQIKFQIFNISHQLLNGDVADANLTVSPNCLVSYNNDIYYKGDSLYATITPSSISSEPFEWNSWNISIVDNLYQELFNIEGDNIISFNFSINNSFEPSKEYYAKVQLYNNSELRGVEYYRFNILNQAPEIIENTISFDSDSIFRTEICTLTLNASDHEDNSTFLEASITVKSPDGQTIILNSVITNNGDGSFTEIIPTSYNYATGVYTVEIKVKDSLNEWSSTSYATFTVKNNPPVVNSYIINGYLTSQPISILYGQNLVFSFNISDVEGIAYVKVALIDENNQWYNITQLYEADIEITVRSTQLITGVWYVYVFVIDNDGSITGLGSEYNTAPQAITIIPDLLSALLPWIALIIGLAVGIIAGVGIGFYRIKSKYLESQAISKKKKAPVQQKQTPKKKPQPKTETVEKKAEDKPQVYDKKESEKKPPQRKIKRKL